MGFVAVEKLAQKLDIEISKNKFQSIIGEGIYKGEKIVLVKPQTYMNLSGNAVIETIDFYKIPLDDLIVIYDDIDVEFGKIRIRPEGSAGTHNGMRNISDMLQSHDFPRVRIGTGRPDENQDLAKYVLGNFNGEEKKIIETSTDMAAEAVIEIFDNGVQKAMNRFN